MRPEHAPFALVTGVSCSLGFALAEQCVLAGFDLLVAAADDSVDRAAARLREHGGVVEAVCVDLGDPDGVNELCAIAGALARPVDALLIGPTRSFRDLDRPAPAFLDRTAAAVEDAFDLAILAPVRLAHSIGAGMRRRGRGRMLLACASGAGADDVTAAGASAFMAGFGCALRRELQDSGVTVTCLLPQAGCGAPQPSAASPEARASRVAAEAFESMMRGDLGLTPGAAAAIAFAGGWAPRLPPPVAAG